MGKLTLARAKELLAMTTTEGHLFEHAQAVSACMGAMARHFGADEAYWQAVGWLHDYDFEQYPDEHLAHTEKPLRDAGVDEESIYAILAHGYDLVNQVEPKSVMDKSLFTVDELSGLIAATAKMHPEGIAAMKVSSVKKKFKDKRFAAKIDRGVIARGCEMLGMDLSDVIALCIEGMTPFATELGIGPKE
ncbi:MAG: hydrolase [Gemmiger sp.]